MPELPVDFDLKLMPDWLKEPATKNPYADYEGRDDDRRFGGRGGDDRGARGRPDDRRGKPGGGQRPGGPRGDGGRRDDRGGRDVAGGRKPDGRRPDRPGGRPDERREKPGAQGRPEGSRGQDSRDQHAPPTQPANVTIEFFPNDGCSVSIARQIKSTHRAYSLFDLARMFLARPERHRLKITAKSVAEPLYQVGEDGPVSTDRAAAERTAFPISRQKLYLEITEQREAPKGNFSNVARCRANGVLLGPTNYHGYQPALRKLYEERFSRRLSFAEFQREIEVVSDPALVEEWKQQSSNVTVYRLKLQGVAPSGAASGKKEPAIAAQPLVEEKDPAEGVPEEQAAETSEQQVTPEAASAETAPAAYEGPVFDSLNEVEQHFRENYLPGIIRAGSSFHLSGEASRALSDRAIAAAVRQAWEQERGFPGQMMHHLRQQFSRSGLHIFKHRKRMQFVSLIRPSPMEDGNLSPSVAEILHAIQANQKCNRASLAASILGTDENAVDPARKTTLATDLRWLIETGRVIEFSDGRLELPVAPAKNEPGKPEAPVEKAKSEIAPSEVPVAQAPERKPQITEAALETPAVLDSGRKSVDSDEEIPALPAAAEDLCRMEHVPEPALKEPTDQIPLADCDATAAESPAAQS